MSTQPNAMAQQDSEESTQGPQAVPARYVRFGAFLADLERSELFQNGQRVKVQAKLFQALELLLRRAGDVVTREEVRCHLWPDAFLTNLDANVNTTMNKLRQVLGDSPESPVYIETIPRRGYSFLAAVQFSDNPSLATLEMPPQKVPTVAEVGGPRALWSNERFYLFARVVSLLFGGMLLGALLTFVWFFSQGRYHRASSGTSTSRSLTQYELYSLAGLAREKQLNPRA